MGTYRVIGVMSGTSLDGLDIACVDFTRKEKNEDSWTYQLHRAECYPYTEEWRNRLKTADVVSGQELVRLHFEYSHLVGQTVKKFIDEKLIEDAKNKSVDLCACHGHTVFHQPENGFTFQIGDGETIATYLSCPVVTNFRTRDVALGGQGAPLVPVGERHLFPDYELCLNLGGISNVSSRSLGIAFDIGPCNMLLNLLASRHDPRLSFDKDGQLARCGLVDNELMLELEALKYYQKLPPKSLGKEWFDSEVLPILDRQNKYAVNLLRTSVEHIASEIARSIKYLVYQLKNHNTVNTSPNGSATSSNENTTAIKPQENSHNLLVTGGGAHNGFLLERIKSAVDSEIGPEVIVWDSIMDPKDIDFKEAIVFGFHGLRRILGLVNVDRMITGARLDSVAGCVSLGNTELP